MIRVHEVSIHVPDLSGAEEVAQRLIEDATAAGRNHWIQLAAQRLHTTRQDYIQAIQPATFFPGVGILTLTGALAHVLEEGMPQMDMRTTLLGANVPVANGGGPGKHLSAAGHYYRAIPFRHRVPKGGAPSSVAGGLPMGYAQRRQLGEKGALDLGKVIYKQAKKLEATTSEPGGRTRWGERLPAGVGGVQKLKPHHKTDIYAGMVRERKTYQGATQSQYFTFRMISTNPEHHPSSWIREATEGIALAPKVEVFLQDLIQKLLSDVRW